MLILNSYYDTIWAIILQMGGKHYHKIFIEFPFAKNSCPGDKIVSAHKKKYGLMMR